MVVIVGVDELMGLVDGCFEERAEAVSDLVYIFFRHEVVLIVYFVKFFSFRDHIG